VNIDTPGTYVSGDVAVSSGWGRSAAQPGDDGGVGVGVVGVDVAQLGGHHRVVAGGGDVRGQRGRVPHGPVRRQPAQDVAVTLAEADGAPVATGAGVQRPHPHGGGFGHGCTAAGSSSA
jgi:hypothetical protein